MTADFARVFEQKTREILTSEANRERVAELAYHNFVKSFGCSQSILQAYQEVLGFEDSFWFKALGTLQGGGFSGLTCGALTTGLILIGGRMGRNRLEEGMGAMLPAFGPCQELAQWFKPMYKSTLCSEITGVNWFDIHEVAARFLGPDSAEAHEKCARIAGGDSAQGSGDTEPAIVAALAAET